MNKSEILFDEKQYLGYNKYSLLRRMVLAIFCFLIFFYSEDIPDAQGNEEALFFAGIFILVMSVVLVFILHIHTTVSNGSLTLDGLWTARKVKIDLQSIASVEKVAYSKYLMNRPVYNLHIKGKIKFFTKGNDAIQLTDKDGLIYLIGTQKASELLSVIEKQLNTNIL